MRELLTNFLGARTTLANSIATVLLLLLILFGRWVGLKAIREATALVPEARLRWSSWIRNTALFVFVLFGVMIWASELRTFALSLVAVAAAFVVATKELILCFSGALVRSSSNSYAVGDRIEILGLRGDVIDISVFSTTILEIGPGQTTHQKTGRAVTLPNSMLLTAPVVNESFTEEFVLHSFIVPIAGTDDWRLATRILEEAASEACAGHLEEARRHFATLKRETGLDTPNPEPRVTLQVPEPARINLVVRIPSSVHDKGKVEQAILRAFLGRADEIRRVAPTLEGPA